MANMLTTTEIVRRTGWDPDAIRRYQNELPVREWLGGKDSHPNYPIDSLAKFEQMLALAQDGVKPKSMMGMILQSRKGPSGAAGNGSGAGTNGYNQAPPPGDAPPPGSLAPFVHRIMDMSAAEVDDAMDNALARAAQTLAKEAVAELQKAGVLSKPEDRLMKRDEVAQMLACKPSAVGRRVKPVMPDTWAFSHVQEYIVKVIQRADERNEAREKRKRERAAVPDAEFTVAEG